jgi:hypothetical protein
MAMRGYGADNVGDGGVWRREKLRLVGTTTLKSWQS